MSAWLAHPGQGEGVKIVAVNHHASTIRVHTCVIVVKGLRSQGLTAHEGRPGGTRETRRAGRDPRERRAVRGIRRAGRETGTTREAHSYPRGGRGLGGAHTDSEATAAAGAAVATARRADKTKNVAGSTVE